MNIDLSKIGNGHELNGYERNVLLSGYVYNNIINVNREKRNKFNYLIVSVNVYNILENHQKFRRSDSTNPKDGIYFVGSLAEFDVYADVFADPNTVLLQYDKQERRDKRIDLLLNEKDFVEEVSINFEGI